jgi:hypothetical protein
MNKDKLDVIPLNIKDIRKRIYTIKGFQVILDSDLAKFYNVETKQLNKAVKRNIFRFPNTFRFQLNKNDYTKLKKQFLSNNNLRFQNGTSKGGRRYLPYAFTEQGVAMLSAILHSKTAINTSIQIINAFVNMRRFISSNRSISNRLEHVEQKQIEYNSNFKKIFTIIDNKENKLKDQGIFFNGEIFDSYKFVVELLKSAKISIILIDNYIDESILTLFTKINKKIKVKIYTNITDKTNLDVNKYNSQYNNIKLIDFKKSHDRFLIIDNKEIYHIGASLKDLGKRWFAFSKIDLDINLVLNKLKI